MDIDRARDIDDARRIDEMYEDDGLTASERLVKKLELNADATIELFLNECMFGGIGKQAQNASANWFAENMWELMRHHAANDKYKFDRDASEFMRHLIMKLEVSQ